MCVEMWAGMCAEVRTGMWADMFSDMCTGMLVATLQVCNFDELGLMEHDDVTTLFHEFGVCRHVCRHVFRHVHTHAHRHTRGHAVRYVLYTVSLFSSTIVPKSTILVFVP